jgi:hypothetical protein
MIYTICYISNKTETTDKASLEKIFATTQANNKHKSVTGILLFHEQSFLQVLEGDKTTLQELFLNIKKDSRHENIFVILDKKNERRIFDNYKSGFSIVKSKSDIKNLKDYLNLSKSDLTTSKSILSLLEPFLF